MTTQLSLYNDALLDLGERRLVALTDENEARRSLDDVWQGGDLVDFLLAQGLWNFATRTVELTYSPSISPSFGYRFAFDIPSDFISTSMLSGDEYFSQPLDYAFEQQYLFCDYETIYWQYVSNDEDYGNDMTHWGPAFSRWAAAYMAYRVARRVTGSATVQGDMYKLQQQALTDARSQDAMDQAIAYPPSGTWVRSRSGHGGQRGKRGQLIG